MIISDHNLRSCRCNNSMHVHCALAEARHTMPYNCLVIMLLVESLLGRQMGLLPCLPPTHSLVLRGEPGNMATVTL